MDVDATIINRYNDTGINIYEVYMFTIIMLLLLWIAWQVKD